MLSAEDGKALTYGMGYDAQLLQDHLLATLSLYLGFPLSLISQQVGLPTATGPIPFERLLVERLHDFVATGGHHFLKANEALIDLLTTTTLND